jgi:P27 family predicted phage terminase small subunit
LSARGRALWDSLIGDFVLDDAAAHELLRRACEASDRADQALAVIDAEGVTFKTRFGEPRVHPAVAVERDARNAVRQMLTALRVLEVQQEV